GVDRSIARLTRAVAIAESTRATLAADRHRAAYAALGVRAYEDLALDLLARGDATSLEKAFETTERARSRTLLEAMLRAIDRAGSPTTTVGSSSRELAALRARLSALHAAGPRPDAAGERRGPAISTTLDTMHETERAIDDVIARLENARGLGALLAAPLDAPAIQARLGEGDALISYFASGDELLAFTGTGERLGCVRAIAPMSEVAPLVEKFLYLLREGARRGDPDADARAIHAMSRAIAGAVVAPVLRAAPELRDARRLCIVPCGALHALPFALLDAGDGPLVVRHEIQVAPSASIACAPVRAGTRTRAAVIAFADGAAPLIDEEAARIAAILGCGALSGERATREGLRDAIAGANVVHLACHGRFVPSLPSASGLRLADGWLPLRDIVDLRLDADLVFLSGCETGRHAVDAGEELSGLARAFHAAGARRLVTTLWSVRDAAALAVAEGFHTSLRAGSRPSAALRDSMLALRHESPHPSWWAPFAVSGVL
ncbi:MAG: CHAT domain-containing protein, partial [Planctomycetaceae bacterium]|nr:CHAT domain-containing protein [Planctomycetaceae bacterium]